jgi:hypothetical protein
MALLRIVIPFLAFGLSMIFSENRYTLFRIMRQIDIDAGAGHILQAGSTGGMMSGPGSIFLIW